MSRVPLFVFVLAIFLTVLAPPGLCPCWLDAQVEAHHPHFYGARDHEHSHHYLFQLFSADTGGIYLRLTIPGHVLIALIAVTAIFWSQGLVIPVGRSWSITPPSPPPRRV